MENIDNIIIDLVEALEPLNGPDDLDEELIDKLREQSGRSSATWACSTCGVKLTGGFEDFMAAHWMMAVVASPSEGWIGYIRITQCGKCRDDPETTKNRMALLDMLDKWNKEPAGGERR